MSTPLTRRDLLDFLDGVEKRYPVDTWKINGIHIWPLIKIDIYFRHVKTEGRDIALSELIDNKVKLNPFRKALETIASFIRYILLNVRKKRKVDAFFSDSSDRREYFNGAFINRFYKPITDTLAIDNPTFASITINDDRKDLKRYPKDEQLFFIRKYLRGAILWLKVTNKRVLNANVAGLNEFLTELGSSKLKHLLETNYLHALNRRANGILAISHIIQILIKKHRPNVIFELCYYNTLQFAINHAAFKLGVKTIEIQHGGMGRDHVGYSGWHTLPKTGYNIFPQIFWLWDEPSKRLLDKWTDGHPFHTTIMGGNPWIAYVTQNGGHYTFPTSRHIILYTLQYDDIPPHVIEAIKSTPQQFQWWIRLHPRKLQAKSIITELLLRSEVNPCHFEIEKATNYPLPIILAKSYVHVSGSSGSIIEAAEMGVFSIIVESLGEIYYKDLIMKGKAMASFTREDIIEALINLRPDKTLISEIDNHMNYKTLARSLVYE